MIVIKNCSSRIPKFCSFYDSFCKPNIVVSSHVVIFVGISISVLKEYALCKLVQHIVGRPGT